MNEAPTPADLKLAIDVLGHMQRNLAIQDDVSGTLQYVKRDALLTAQTLLLAEAQRLMTPSK